MKSVLVLGTILVSVLLAVACSSAPDVTSGTVTGKHYLPPYSSTAMECWGYDAKGNCYYQATVPVEYPECWQLLLADQSNNTGSVCVYDFVYKRYEIGQQYP